VARDRVPRAGLLRLPLPGPVDGQRAGRPEPRSARLLVPLDRGRGDRPLLRDLAPRPRLHRRPEHGPVRVSPEPRPAAARGSKASR
jgi:hypothetical protein